MTSTFLLPRPINAEIRGADSQLDVLVMISGTMTVYRNSDLIQRFCSRTFKFTKTKKDEEESGAVSSSNHWKKTQGVGWVGLVRNNSLQSDLTKC